MSSFEHTHLHADNSSVMAGLLAVIVHLLLVLGGALTLRMQANREADEQVREVGIVLTPATQIVAANDATPYDANDNFTDWETADDSRALNDTALDSTADVSAAALPTTVDPLHSSPQIALPGDLRSLEVESSIDRDALRSATTLNNQAAQQELLAAALAEAAKRPKVLGPQGPAGEMQIFGGVPTHGHSFVFLIDRSQSMGSEGLGAIAAAEVELLRALDRLAENHRFQVIAYNQTTSYLSQRKLLAVNEQSRAECRDFLNNLIAAGATNHVTALMSALQLHPDVLYLLTDGDPVITAAQRRRIRSECQGRTAIHCLHFGRAHPDDDEVVQSLQTLARENGGDYQFIDMNAPRRGK